MGRLGALLHGPLRTRHALATGGAARSAILGSIAVTGSQLAVGALYALASLYLVRSFSTHEYGRAAFGIYIYTLLMTVAGLGLGASVMAEIARGRRSDDESWPTVHTLLWVRVLSVAPVLLVGFGWAAVAQDVLPAMGSVVASTAIVAEFLIWVLAGQLRSRAYAVVIAFQPASYVALLLVLRVRTAEVGLIALGTALALSLLLAVAFVGFRARPRIGWPEVALRDLGHALGVARDAYLIGLLQVGFISIPIILLGGLGRFAEAAALSIVMALVRLAPEALGLAVVSTYFPRLKAVDPLGHEARALFGTFARLLAFLAIPAAIGLAVMARPVLGLLFDGRYDDLAPFLAIGSLLVLLLPAESLLTWTLVARSDGRVAMLAMALRLATVLAACLALGGTDDRGSLLLLMVASAAGVLMSVAIQAVRSSQVATLPWPALSFAVYGFVAAAAYLAIRAVTGTASDAVAVLVTALATLPVLGFGAWIFRRPHSRGPS